MDINRLSKICLGQILSLQSARLPGPGAQSKVHIALGLLESLHLAEEYEEETKLTEQVQNQFEEQPLQSIPTLPVQPPLTVSDENPKEISFDTFLFKKPLPSLRPQEPVARLPVLCKSVALAATGQALLPEERELLGHFLACLLYTSDAADE